MWNVLKKRASYMRVPISIAKDTDPVSVKAGDRLDALNEQTAAGKLGPFAGSASDAAPTSEKEDFPLPSEHEPDAAALADHHQKLADYFAKVAHPGSQSLPATSQLSPDEKFELGSEIDMKP